MLTLNPYRIGFRTLKTAVGITLGVILAKWIGLDNYASSAILIVLCIKHTKVHSLQAIGSRFVSCLLMLFFGSFIFHLIINEILLLIIGLGIAFLMNLIMPSLDNTLGNFKKEIENEIKTIFTQYSEACLNINKQLSISFDTLENNIRKAKSIAFRDVKNHFVRNENSYYHYFDMREEQLEILRRIQTLIHNTSANDPLLETVAHLMAEIGDNVNSNDYTVLRLHSLYEIRLKLDELPLPESHQSLKSRASMMQILNELEEYLNIKSQFGSLKLHSEI